VFDYEGHVAERKANELAEDDPVVVVAVEAVTSVETKVDYLLDRADLSILHYGVVRVGVLTRFDQLHHVIDIIAFHLAPF
jgi:hypothetical protein